MYILYHRPTGMAADVAYQGRRLLQSLSSMEYSVPTEQYSTNSTTVAIPKSTVKTVRSCDHIDDRYNIVIAVICSMCFIFGIIYTFFGYRFFKAVMFLTGFIFSSVLVYIIFSEHDILPLEGDIGVALGVGLIVGLITMLVQYAGLFFTGFQLGVSLAIGILVVLEFFHHPETKWIPIGIICGVGVIVAVLTLKFQKGCTILGTSVFGGALMVSCIDYFIEHFAMVAYVWERAKGEVSDPVCWFSWVLLGCWPFCFIVGSITQWKITGQGYDHKEVLSSKKVKKVNLHRARQRDRGDTQQSRYRHLYKVRRVTGDVISQSYLQTMQQKLSPSTKRRDHIAIPTEPSVTELESTNTTLTQVP